MTRVGWLAIVACAIAGVSLAQAPAFEVVSIKRAPPRDGRPRQLGPSGGPGTSDPGIFTCGYCSVRDLILQAFGIVRFELAAPNWVDKEEEAFDISSRVPAEATPEQFRAMLRNMLRDRFQLAAHRETREIPLYQLTIARGGSKLKPARENTATGIAFALDKEGFPLVPAGRNVMSIRIRGEMRIRALKESIAELAATLSRQLSAPVNDLTGLPGAYAFSLRWATSADPPLLPGDEPAQPLEIALEQQLGLKITKTKGPIEMVIIDHLERVPSEN